MRMRARSATMAAALLTFGAPAAEGQEIFSCDFPKAGRVVIDTREDSRSITWNGVRYPAQSGSYFFQGTDAAPPVDGEPIVVMFGPDFGFWDFRGERSDDCEERTVPASSRGAAGADRRRLEGMDYNLARRIIVDEYGWMPLRGACDGAGVSTGDCAASPEIDVCAGTGLGRCVMRFDKPGRCLIVGTIGGPPDGVVDGEPEVDRVTFLDGACP